MNPKSIFIFSVLSILVCSVFLHTALAEETLKVYTAEELKDMTNDAVAALTPEQRVNISEEKAQKVFEYVHDQYKDAVDEKNDVVHDLEHLIKIKSDVDGNIDTAAQSLTTHTATALGAALSLLLVNPTPALVTGLGTGSINSIIEAMKLIDAGDAKTAVEQLLFDTESQLIEMTYEGYTNTELGETYLPLTTLAERNNQFLSEWDAKVKARDPNATTTLADGSKTYTPVDAPSYTRNYDPPVASSKAAAVPQRCRGCSEVLLQPYLETTIIISSLSADLDNVITETIYSDHGIVCSETRFSTGNGCDGGLYFKCPSPDPGTATVCPHDSDHQMSDCPFGAPKHPYAKGSPGDHGQLTVPCGQLLRTKNISVDGRNVSYYKICTVMTYKCASDEHPGSHGGFSDWTRLAPTASLGSGSNHICANPSCEFLGSGSGSSSALPVEGRDAYTLASQAFFALHWNHRVSLGIGASSESSPSTPIPELSYAHQRTCPNGGVAYWTCSSSDAAAHAPRTC